MMEGASIQITDIERSVSLKSKGIDFCRGNIVQQLLLFSIPIMLGELLQNLYNSVDALMVGKFVGKEALAAVSICVGPSDLMIGFFNGMSVGSSVVVAHAFGLHNRDKLLRTIRVSYTFSVLFGVSMAILGILCSPLMLQAAGAQAAVFDTALSYLRIYLSGLLFTVIYNISAGILRAVGDSNTPFRILTISCCLNILLDVLFVKLLNIGVIGAAMATVFSQLCSVILIYRRLCQFSSDFRISFREMRDHLEIVWKVISIGIPSGLQSAMIAISNLFVWRYINSFGTDASAGIGVAMRLDRFALMPCKAFGMSLTTFVGQNVGAKQYRRSRSGILCSLGLAASFTILLGGGIYIFAAPCVALFNSDPAVVAIGAAMIHTIIPFYLVLDVREILFGVLRGYGYTQVPMILSVLGMIVVRQIFLAVTMPRFHAIELMYICFPVGWVATVLLLLGYYLRIRKKCVELEEL